MSRKRHPYTKRLKLIKAGTGTEYISDEPVKDGRVVVLRVISAENKTSALTKIRFGKKTGGFFLPWAEQKAPAANELVFSDDIEHWIRQGEFFQAELVGGAANDECWVYLDGYWFTWNGDEADVL